MLNLDHRILRELASSAETPTVAFALEAGVVVITNGHWALITDNPSAYFSPIFIECIEHCPVDFVTDFRGAIALEVDWEARRFLPEGERRFLPLYVPEHSALPAGTRIDRRAVTSLFNEYDAALSSECFSFSAEMNQGRVRPIYGEESGVAKRPAAGNYLCIKDGIVVSLTGRYVRAFHEIGFDIQVPLSATVTTHVGMPPMRLVLDSRLYGYMMPCSPTEIDRTEDGRPLFVDAGKACWLPPEKAWAILVTNTALYNPDRFDQRDLVTDRLAIAGETYHNAGSLYEARLAVSALRWQGTPEEDIQQVLEDRHVDAWGELYENVVLQIHQETDEYVRSRKPIDTWRVSRVRAFIGSGRRLADLIEACTEQRVDQSYLDTIEQFMEGYQCTS